MPYDIQTKQDHAGIKCWIPEHEVEPQAVEQLRNIASLPIIFKHLAVMPDCHLGRGACVGSVIATKNAISPAAVGVDIGCGMAAVKTNFKAHQLPDNLHKIRSKVEKMIPVGNGPAGARSKSDNRKHSPGVLNHFKKFKMLPDHAQDFEHVALNQVGTLGGGNHFIELCLDENDNIWLMLHSGSRRIGQAIAQYHISIAKKLEHNKTLKDKDLAYFLANTSEMDEYRRDLMWAQEYARLNRKTMLEEYMKVLKDFFPGIKFDKPIQCHHNYVAEEVHFGEEVLVTRKGAIRAEVGDMGIIPGSMGTKSYIVKGLGNADAFCSASHGAGRRMSRTAAKKMFHERGVDGEIARQLDGVECRRDPGIADELPEAYKDIDGVIAAQSDLVTVVATLKQVLCIKG